MAKFTSFPTAISTTSQVLLADQNDLAILVSGTGAADTTASIYQHGCLYYRTDSGTGSNAVYQNTGSSAVPSWTLVDTGVAFSVPTTATDATSTTTDVFTLISSALTTGQAYVSQAVAATLTGAGRYFQSHDGAGEVWGIGPNGHMISTSTTTANATTTALITVNGGISAVALVSGSTDTCGRITTTGTQGTTTDSTFTVTFGKAYEAAPKAVIITPANLAASATTSNFYVLNTLVGTTSFVVGVGRGINQAATPSYYYMVIG